MELQGIYSGIDEYRKYEVQRVIARAELNTHFARVKAGVKSWDQKRFDTEMAALKTHAAEYDNTRMGVPLMGERLVCQIVKHEETRVWW